MSEKENDKEYEEEYELYEEISVSYACEDCDYRWESVMEHEDEADRVQYCPMCGSSNTTQI